MPRLTSRDYLTHRQFLRQYWEERDGAGFADLPLHYQRDLHDYYAPSVPISEKQALRHRAEITKAFPSLPQKAGRAYQAIRAAKDKTPNMIAETHRAKTTSNVVIAGKERSIRIAGIAKPEIDHYRLARAMVNLMTADVDGKLLAKANKLRDRRLR